MGVQRADTDTRPKLDGLDAARAYFAGRIARSDPTSEWFWVAHLDDRANCLHLSRHRGGPEAAEVPIRSIILDAARMGSAGLLLAHNHPSGDPRPSRADCRATQKLVAVAGALGCEVVDHLVFAGDQCTSFRRIGLL